LVGKRFNISNRSKTMNKNSIYFAAPFTRCYLMISNESGRGTTNEDQNFASHSLVGDTYTILLSGNDTDGRYCLIDMLIPPGGRPAPHRHDFEESFTLLEGKIETVIRSQKIVLRAGETINIPANAPALVHQHVRSAGSAAVYCSPAGQEAFFEDVGVRLATRTTRPPEPDKASRRIS